MISEDSEDEDAAAFDAANNEAPDAAGEARAEAMAPEVDSRDDTADAPADVEEEDQFVCRPYDGKDNVIYIIKFIFAYVITHQSIMSPCRKLTNKEYQYINQ